MKKFGNNMSQEEKKKSRKTLLTSLSSLLEFYEAAAEKKDSSLSNPQLYMTYCYVIQMPTLYCFAFSLSSLCISVIGWVLLPFPPFPICEMTIKDEMLVTSTVFIFTLISHSHFRYIFVSSFLSFCECLESFIFYRIEKYKAEIFYQGQDTRLISSEQYYFVSLRWYLCFYSFHFSVPQSLPCRCHPIHHVCFYFAITIPWLVSCFYFAFVCT